MKVFNIVSGGNSTQNFIAQSIADTENSTTASSVDVNLGVDSFNITDGLIVNLMGSDYTLVKTAQATDEENVVIVYSGYFQSMVLINLIITINSNNEIVRTTVQQVPILN